MRLLLILLTIFGFFCSIPSADAGSVLKRVKARNLVRCGSVERMGLASEVKPGVWSGLNVDICRAIAAAVLGSPDRIEYHSYETQKDFDAVRKQQDDVYFLTGSEINTQKLAGSLVPGPTVFLQSEAVMVAANSAAHHVSDLAGDSICFMIGSSTERSLTAYFDAIHKSWLRRAFSEDGEMIDTYNVQNCHAIADEMTNLAQMRLDPGINQLYSRILPESLTTFPVIAATGTQDGQWSAIVAWTVTTLINADRPQTQWYAGGAGAMPILAPELGLDQQWQKRILASIGNYSQIFERNLGRGSLLKLENRFNANYFYGGLLLAPFLE